MSFDSEVALRRIGCDRWRLLEDLVYEGRHDRFTAPAGFVTDLASVPRVFQSLVPRTGAWDEGAVIHDLLCVDLLRHRLQLRSGHLHPDPPLASARDTDGILRRIIRESGCGPVTQWTVWAAVRWGALGNPARRPGWIRDAPAVAAVTAAALAVLAAVLLALGWIVAVLLGL